MNDENRAAFPCLHCGNDEIDTLVWDEPDTGSDFVTCLICGARYNPLTNQLQRPS